MLRSTKSQKRLKLPPAPKHNKIRRLSPEMADLPPPPGTCAIAKNPLDDIQPEILARLSPEQKEIITLRFTTLMPRHVMAAKLGMNTPTMVSQENKALRILTLPLVIASRESKADEAETTTLDVPSLSQDCRDLHANIGSKSLVKLIDKFGGSRIHIPLYVTTDHKLALLLGMESFSQLSAYCGGELVYIPKQTSSNLGIRNERMRQKYAAGDKVVSIAMEEGVSERHAYHILAKCKRKNLSRTLG